MMKWSTLIYIIDKKSMLRNFSIFKKSFEAEKNDKGYNYVKKKKANQIQQKSIINIKILLQFIKHIS